MTDSFPDDIFTEPPDLDPDTLKNLGPLTPLAGIWSGTIGLDINPKADGPERQTFEERIEFQPIDPQANGPQYYYGLRYHQHVVKTGEVETFHDQIGYWLWEPATETIIQSLAIPRAQVAMAVGKASATATQFELVATRGLETFGICSNPFIEHAFKTMEYRIKVSITGKDTWTYEQDTVLMVRGRPEPFHHTDKSVLKRIGEPTPNPLIRGKPW